MDENALYLKRRTVYSNKEKNYIVIKRRTVYSNIVIKRTVTVYSNKIEDYYVYVYIYSTYILVSWGDVLGLVATM